MKFKLCSSYDRITFSSASRRASDTMVPANQLFYGDNLTILRDYLADASVDLIYLNPPFNSNANYNILFKSPTGAAADSQIEAFEDTWHYGPEAAQAFHEVMESGRTDLANLLRAMQSFLGQNDMMAYLAMMAVRLIELHRVLKPTGSLYLHCDPTASHYLKLLLDAVFGARSFRNEIVWCYTGPGSPGMRQFMRKHDVVFWYSKGPTWTFNADAVRIAHSEKTRGNYKAGLTGSGFVGADHLIHESGKVPEDYWNFAIAPRGKEYLGYPTQKPLKLLERIIAASSNPGDIVLDPFCGCGTAVHAAQKLGRQWVGIDITYLSIGLIQRRLMEAFPDINFSVVGEPSGLDDAQHLAAVEPYQFQYWITQKIGGQPYRGGRKGADRGIDGYIYYTRNAAGAGQSSTAAAIISVKAGRNVGVAMVRDLRGVLEREKADIGVFVCVVAPSRDMEREAAAAGIWTDPVTGEGYPRVQIFTLAELFQGRRPRVPLLDRQAGYRRAPRETAARAQASLF
jgi:DNA modification methylase